MERIEAKQLYYHDYLLRPLVALFPHWVKPNHLTILRFILTPIVLWLLATDQYTWGVPTFVVAAFTDALDGSMARIRGQITNWGIFFDPVADKMLVGSVALLVATQYLNPFIVGAVVGMETIILLGAAWRVKKGTVIPANVWGKIKMFLEFIALLFLLIGVMNEQAAFLAAAQDVFGAAIIFGFLSYVTRSL